MLESVSVFKLVLVIVSNFLLVSVRVSESKWVLMNASYCLWSLVSLVSVIISMLLSANVEMLSGLMFAGIIFFVFE